MRRVNVPLDTFPFGDKSFRAIDFTGTDKETKIAYTLNTKEIQKKTALANKMNYTTIWYPSYDLRLGYDLQPGNGAVPILTASQPTRSQNYTPRLATVITPLTAFYLFKSKRAKRPLTLQ